jgi:hypothetical protein
MGDRLSGTKWRETGSGPESRVGLPGTRCEDVRRESHMMFSSSILCALLLLPWQVPPSDPGTDSSLDSSTASAVSGVRKRMLGRIVQKDGSAWAGAEVRLISWSDWNYPGVGKFDDLHAVTDARGRFSVKGLQHRRYCIWAWQEASDSAYRVSEPGRFVSPGQPFVLKEQELVVRKRMLKVDLTSWSRFGPFRIALRENPFVGAYSASVSKQLQMLVWLPTSLPVGEMVEFPVLPWPHVRVELLGKGGLLLHQQSISLFEDGVGVAETVIRPAEGKQRNARFYLDPRLTKKAKGYKLYQRYLGRMIDLQAVDDDGQGRILLPLQVRTTNDRLWYERGPWYVGRLEGRAQGSDYNLQRSTRVGAGRGQYLRGALAVLPKSHPIQFTVRGPGGKPLAGLPVLIWQREAKIQLRSMVHVLPATMVETDAQGHLVYPWLSKQEYAILAILPDEVLDQLMGDRKIPIHPTILLSRGLGIDVQSNKPRVFAVGDLQDVEFSIAWDKEKIRKAPNVNVFNPIADNSGYTRLLRLSCDLRGRARALVPPDQQLPYLVHSSLGVATGTVTTGAAGDVAEAVNIKTRIPEAIEISGTVRDAQGRPANPAGISLANPWFRSRGQHPLLRFDVSRISVLTDKQGRFRIFQEKVQSPLQLYVTLFRGTQQLRRTVHSLDPAAGLTGLEIEVQGLNLPQGRKQGVPLPKVRRVPVKK